MGAAVEGVRVERGGAVLVGEHWPGDGPVLVLLHAGVCDRRSWAGVVPLLRPAGSVVAYDRRGFGDSTGSDAPFSHLEDLLAVLDAVTHGGKDGRAPVWLVGSSRGGGLALDAALSAPQRVAGLVLLAPRVSGAPGPVELDPATQALSDALDAAEAAGDLDAVNELEVRVWLDGPAAPAGRVSGPARDLALVMNAAVLRRGSSDDTGASGVDAWPRLGQVRVPTTVATGDLDAPYLVERAEDLLATVPGARRAHLPATAHLPHLERPDLVADVITNAVAGG